MGCQQSGNNLMTILEEAYEKDMSLQRVSSTRDCHHSDSIFVCCKNNQCSTAKDIENVKDILCDAGLVQVQVDDLSIDMFSRGEGHRVVCGRFVNMKPLRLFGLDKV